MNLKLMDNSKKGTLFIVATPIGNMEDITYRAISTLKNAAFVLAEDTRYTQKLLNRYEIKANLVSYRDQNHEAMISKVIEKLDMGLNLALVSDSGTPLISDPGYKLVAELKLKGYSVAPIPGPSAAIAALSASGLPTDRFTFLGFLPKSDAKRSKLLKEYGSHEETLIIYESPNRLTTLLEQIETSLGADRVITVAGELTKLFEKIVTDKVSTVRSLVTMPKGEYVVLISKA